MNGLCIVVFALVAAASASAHYEGYPFVHKNDGKYGAKYEYANYGGKTAPAYAAPYGYGVGFGFNNEFNYRAVGAYPVHVGAGQFYYLGHFNGDCASGNNYGFYYAGDANSFIVCDNGRSHRFQCPAGTKNRDNSYFQLNHAYGMNELCGVNTLH